MRALGLIKLQNAVNVATQQYPGEFKDFRDVMYYALTLSYADKDVEYLCEKYRFKASDVQRAVHIYLNHLGESCE